MTETAGIPPAPAAALTESEWWHGPRCACGLPAIRGILDTPKRPVLIHPYWQPATCAYLNDYPHNVEAAGPDDGGAS